MTTDDILDDLFHGISLAAFVSVAVAHQGPPPSDEVRRLAYHLYEQELAARNAAKQPAKEEP